MREKINLEGMTFTLLEVITESPKKRYDNQEIIWQCKCTCGKICHVPGYFLRNHIKKSCGCLWKPHNAEYISNLKYRLESNSKWIDQCHVWTGPVNRKGFGKILFTPKTYILVHRLSWMIHVGKLSKKAQIKHTCGNPLCFRIEHLVLYT